MNKPFFQKPSSLTEWILLIIGTSITLSSPYGARRISKELIKCLENNISPDEMNSLKPGKVSQAIYRLKKREVISISEKDGLVEIKLTEKGKKKKVCKKINDLCIDKPDSWDGKWRIVTFDIPETKRSSREALREKLKKLDLLQFQKSVWIYPYDCRKEIDFVADIFDVGECISIITAKIDDDEPLKTFFDLS